MVHKSSIIPGLSKFLDSAVLSQYPPTSLKRILAAGGMALYLQRNEHIVDKILNHPMISTLGVTDNGMIDIDTLKEVIKVQVSKAGYMRVHIPILGDTDFTIEDIDSLYKAIISIESPPASITPTYGG
jgi:hypothetical protein